MNVVFNTKSLKVISLFDAPPITKSDQEILRYMFPQDFKNLSLWSISRNIDRIPIGLSIKLDKSGNPESIYFKNKEIYHAPELQNKQNAKNDKKLDNDKKLRASNGIVLGKALSDFLIRSPYTKQNSINNLSSTSLRPIPVILKGFFNVSTGYASICRNVLLRLHNYGIFAKPEYFPSNPDIDPVLLNYLSKYESLRFSRYDKNQVKVLICTPMPGIFNDFRGRKIIFTMMETETLAPDFANGCNKYNEVWVPCKHNRDLFVNGGVKVPVHVVPLGVDERFYFGSDSTSINMVDGLLPLLGKGLKKFKFISLFQWYSRKCPDILIKSFVKAFNDNDDVCLVIVSHHTPPSQVLSEVQRYAKGARGSNYPSIFLYNQIPLDSQMPSVYKFCDALISTSRGEGFSLPPIEAAACGLPVISSYHTAMKDYLNEDNSYIVRTVKKEISPPDLTSMCGWYSGQLLNKLGDEEVEKFAIHLRSVVNNYDVALNKAKKLQNIVKNNYTWDIATSLAARRIREGQ